MEFLYPFLTDKTCLQEWKNQVGEDLQIPEPLTLQDFYSLKLKGTYNKNIFTEIVCLAFYIENENSELMKSILPFFQIKDQAPELIYFIVDSAYGSPLESLMLHLRQKIDNFSDLTSWIEKLIRVQDEEVCYTIAQNFKGLDHKEQSNPVTDRVIQKNQSDLRKLYVFKAAEKILYEKMIPEWLKRCHEFYKKLEEGKRQEVESKLFPSKKTPHSYEKGGGKEKTKSPPLSPLRMNQEGGKKSSLSSGNIQPDSMASEQQGITRKKKKTKKGDKKHQDTSQTDQEKQAVAVGGQKVLSPEEKMRREIEGLKKALQVQKAEADSHQSKLREMQESLCFFEEENATLKKENQALEVKNQKANRTALERQNSVTTLTRRNSKLLEKINSVKQNLDKVKQENQTLSGLVAVRERKLQEIEGQQKERENKLKQAKTTLQTQEKDQENQNQTLKQISQQIQAESKRTDTQQNSKKLNELVNEQATLKEKINSLNDVISQQKMRIEQYETEVVKHEGEKKNLVCQAEKLKEAEQTQQLLLSQTNVLQEQIGVFGEEKGQLLAYTEMFNHYTNSLVFTIDQQQGQITNLIDQLVQWRDYVFRLKNGETLEQVLDRERELRREDKIKIEGLEAMLEDLKKQLQDQQVQVEISKGE